MSKNVLSDFFDNKDAMLTAIDRGEWKHSWHLPKDEYGYIKWDDETVKKIEEVLSQSLLPMLCAAAEHARLLEIVRAYRKRGAAL